MYCSSCGSVIPPGLSYCNRCGVDLRQKENSVANKSAGASPDSLVWGIVAVTTTGLCALIAVMVIMKEVLHFNDGLIGGFSAATFLSFLLVDLLFAWLLVRSKKPSAETEAVELKEAIRAELYAAQTSGLADPTSIVMDHTTRTLDPVPRVQQSAKRDG